MFVRRSKLVVLSMLLIASMVLSACGPTTVEIVKTVVVTEEVIREGTPQIVEKVITATPKPESATGFIPAAGLVACNPLPEVAFSNSRPSMPNAGIGKIAASSAAADAEAAKVFEAPMPGVPQQTGAVYRVGVFEDITSLNYWVANGPGNTVWNAYMLPQRLRMYTLSDKYFTFVPQVAAEMPPPLTQEGGKWVVEIKLREDVTWSDGTSLTAEDVAFTANTVLKIGLIGGNWGNSFDANFLEAVEAVDTYLVRYIYHTRPGLARHEWGTLQAPILSKAYWEPVVAAAVAPIDALGTTATDEEKAAAQSEAQKTIFAHVPDGEPLAGAFTMQKWEADAFLEVAKNPNYFDTGLEIRQWSNGAYEDSDGFTTGNPDGEVETTYTVGPFVDSVVYSIYGSQDAAILALRNGEVDYVLNSLGLQRGLAQSISADLNLSVITNPTNGFRYLSFNNRRRPMNDCSFRQAVAVLIDKEFVTGTVLQGAAYPLYTFIPEGNKAWYFDGTPQIGKGLNREQRIELAVAILEEAGYTWEGDLKPVWDAENRKVIRGGVLIMPDGTPVPELSLLAPSPGYDPLRATFAVWIESWLNEAGIPLKADLTGFNAMIPQIYSEQDFDMFILGWSLGIFPGFLRDFFSEEQAVLEGNNAGGYINPEFEDLSAGLLTCDSEAACKELADQIQILLATELPYVLLFDAGIVEAYRSASLEYPYTSQLGGLQFTHNGGTLQSEVKMK